VRISTGNHYLPVWYQWRFHSKLGGDFNREINNYELAISNRIISLPGGNLREIITYHCDISGGFIQYLTGISIRGIIVWNQWLSAPDFKTESLVYWMDINGKSLLTCVVSIAVSFNTRRGFQWRNHCAESMIISSSDFKTESFIDIHRKSLLTCVVSIAASFSSQHGFHSRNHRVESIIFGSRFQNRIISLSGGYPREIITYLGGINCSFIR